MSGHKLIDSIFGCPECQSCDIEVALIWTQLGGRLLSFSRGYNMDYCFKCNNEITAVPITAMIEDGAISRLEVEVLIEKHKERLEKIIRNVEWKRKYTTKTAKGKTS